MALLSGSERVAAWRRYMELGGAPGDCLKAQIRAVIDAADSWADSNSASYNAALPLPFRNSASPAEKALVLAIVIGARAGRRV